MANCLHSTRSSSSSSSSLSSSSRRCGGGHVSVAPPRSHHQTLNCVNTVKGSEGEREREREGERAKTSAYSPFKCSPPSPVPNSIISTLVTRMNPSVARVGKLGGELSHVVIRGYLRLGWSRVFEMIRRYCRLPSYVWSDCDHCEKSYRHGRLSNPLPSALTVK